MSQIPPKSNAPQPRGNMPPKRQSTKQMQKDKEAGQIDDNLRLRAPTIFEIISKEGEEELRRPTFSLWASGLAAGLGISFSVFAEGILHNVLDGNAAQELIENFGYCLGFLIVILGRLQLFTENTITVVLPVLKKFSMRSLLKTARLWGIVFSANMIGTCFTAFFTIYTGIFTAEQISGFNAVSHHFVERSIYEAFQHGIPAGFIIAAMVWMMPSSKGNEFWVIILMTYIIALGGFTHVVAGSTEVFLLTWQNQLGWLEGFGYILATGAGNIMGGSVLFALLAYAQTRGELHNL